MPFSPMLLERTSYLYPPMSSFEFFLARKYFWAQRRNLSSGLIALFSALGVMLGTWLLIFVLSAINGFEEEVKKQLMGKDAHVEVSRYQYVPVENPDSLRREILKGPEVVAAAPYVLSKTVISYKSSQDGILVYGIDDSLSRDVIGISQSVTRGTYKLDSIRDENGRPYPAILLGYALADRLGAQVGDKVFLADFSGTDFLAGGMMPRIQPCIVAGTFESGMYQYDETLAYLSLPAAQKLFGLGTRATGVQLRIRDPRQSGAVSAAIEERLGFPYRALDWQSKNATLIKWMDYEKVLISLALGIIIIIAAFNIISSLIMVVNDKTREIGILRAMGATRRSILRIFVYEGMMVGLFGSVTGTALGLLSYWIQKEFGWIQLPGDVYFVTTLPVQLKLTDVLGVLFVTNFLCGVATLLPALKAARQDPVEAIRHE
jgi:lipoprotein-releasing system permease protein